MKPLFQVPLKFGLIGAGIKILMFFVLLWTDANPLLEMQVFNLIILPVFIFFGIKEFRDTFNQGILSFSEGMTIGLIIYLLIGLLYGAFLAGALNIIDTSVIMEEYIATNLQKLEESRSQFGQKEFEESYRENQNSSIYVPIKDIIIRTLLIGFLLTSLLSTVLRKQPKK
ncbi:MAG: DUF4199 domain-containing protein [Reichenbachiella sp.]|uniref:DUF4199 domain-containing protein n=1 Tax=Reichenbachiella sp. TaxID=2184521 RepID=UPI0032645DC7